MRFRCSLASLVLAICLTAAWSAKALSADPSPPALPFHPRILEAARAPRTAKILRLTALTYAPHMSPKAREIDFFQKLDLAKRLLGVGRLPALRHQTLNLLLPWQKVSWETLRRQYWPGGDPVGVTLEVPVWVPARARRVRNYCGFAKKWQTVALTRPRPCGYVWFDPSLADINNTARYRPEKLQVEVNSKFAPLAALLLEYIFREGWYDPARRVPLMNVRGGEDTYAVSAAGGPVTTQCLSFPDDDGASMAATVVTLTYPNLAAIYHGGHAPASNHRLGLALDLNDFNFPGAVDGAPNPISRALRQYNRNAMHRLDARQMPAWVYQAASWMGCRVPQSWIYTGYHTDWEHIDVGNK